MKKLILLLALSAGVVLAQPPNRWIFLARGPSAEAPDLPHGASMYVDSQTIQYGSGYRSVSLWYKVIFPGSYLLMKLEMEEPGRIRMGATREYALDGTEKSRNDTPEPWEQIAPGTPEETVYNAMIRDAQAEAAWRQAIQKQAQNQAQIEAEIEARVRMRQERIRRQQNPWSYLGCLGGGMADYAAANPYAETALAFAHAAGQRQ